MTMFFFAIALSVAFLCGSAFGATVLADYLARIKSQPAPRYIFPVASIVSTTDWKKLDIATALRRRQ